MMAFALLSLSLVLSGCPKFISIDYKPSAEIRGSGDIALERFHYLPAEEGQVSPTQVQLHPAAVGRLYLTEEIAVFVADALQRELVHAGYDVRPGSDRSITGRIQRFYLNWVGDGPMGFDMKVEFVVRKANSPLYTETVSCHAEQSKLLTKDTATIEEGTRSCLDRFLRAAQDAKAL